MVEHDEPRDYTKDEMAEMARELLNLKRPGFVNHEDPDRPDPPFVRPVNYLCQLIAPVDNPLLTEKEKVSLIVIFSGHFCALGRPAQFDIGYVDQ